MPAIDTPADTTPPALRLSLSSIALLSPSISLYERVFAYASIFPFVYEIEVKTFTLPLSMKDGPVKSRESIAALTLDEIILVSVQSSLNSRCMTSTLPFYCQANLT